MRSALILAISIFSATAFASPNNFFGLQEFQTQVMLQSQEAFNLEWKVGDNANYDINMGFIKGKMNMSVREEVSEGFWIEQNMDLGFLGKQKAEMLIDKYTGEILQFIVNGEKQDIPSQEDQEVIDMKEANVSVPAGSFDCVYLKVRNKKDNKESEAWVNPNLIPVSGLIKQVAPGPMGKVTVSLTSFNKN